MTASTSKPDIVIVIEGGVLQDVFVVERLLESQVVLIDLDESEEIEEEFDGRVVGVAVESMSSLDSNQYHRCCGACD